MAETLYDQVAYPSRPFQQTHPSRMALPAALFGLGYAPPATARVLEIGCGEGGNLIPLALSYPDATFVGFDLAETAIAAGRKIVDSLGLDNIALKTLDILEAGPELGQFDYIIVHGVYSWVPEPVRQGVMRLISACLAPEGLAFVSYNAMPGCHLRMLLREMITHHLRGLEGFEARLAGAREFLHLFIANAPDNDPTAFTIKTYCRSMLERDPRVLFHDELGPIFQPFYLSEFIADARRCDLDFLAESEGVWWREELFPSSRGKAVMEIVGSDPVALHQYLDFLAARLFRQSIICHAGRPVDRAVDYRRIRGLWIAGGVRCVEAEPDLVSTAPLRFELASGAAISLDIPVLKRALFAIGQAWPSPIAVAELPDEPDVHEGLLQMFTAGHLDLTVGPAQCAREPGQRPKASPLARLQLGDGATVLTSLDHVVVSFEDEASRRFLSLLDGSRTQDDLKAAMIDEGHDPTAAAVLVTNQLKGLARLGLLIQ